jgi:DNA polymerase-3 subunit gamma/tau
MFAMDTTDELYKRFRPKSFKQVVGQMGAVKMLSAMVQKGSVPHSLLFTGPSGCGKTTLARILQVKLNCSDGDFFEVNCADFRGIDFVRDIRSRMTFSPIGGKSRIWLIDECHELTKQAQEALLKMLEDTPKHVWFILATTDPNKLLKTIMTRCTEIRLNVLDSDSMLGLLNTTCKRAKVTTPSDEVLDKIINNSEGSARKALVYLNQVISVQGEDAQLEVINSTSMERQAIQICRVLIRPKSTYKEVMDILAKLEEEPEQIRRMILGYFTTVAMKPGKLSARAIDILRCFQDHYYDSGKAGLVLSIWDFYHTN